MADNLCCKLGYKRVYSHYVIAIVQKSSSDGSQGCHVPIKTKFPCFPCTLSFLPVFLLTKNQIFQFVNDHLCIHPFLPFGSCQDDTRVKCYILGIAKNVHNIYEAANVNFSCMRLQALFFQLYIFCAGCKFPM